MLSNLFLLARHGTTFLNSKNFFRGWSNGPDADLNGEGLQAAIDAGFFLARMRNPPTRIICSDLNRTVNTASIICTILGITEFETDRRLRPLNVGDFAGKDKKENPITKYLADKNLRFPGGETVNEFEARQHAFAEQIVSQIAAGKIQPTELLVVAHVSNIMYWENVQSGRSDSDEYLDESTDLVGPGGMVIVTDESVVPILNWSPIAVENENIGEGNKTMAVS
jgi:broad specificity phosphatase PhoE